MNNIPQGYKQTELGVIPKDWEVVELEQGLSFQVGFPFVSEHFNGDAIGLRLVRNRDLKSDDQIIYYSGKYQIEYVVHNGNVLVSMDGDFLPCIWQKGVALLNQRVGRIITRTNWNEIFLFYLLFEPLSQKQEKTGATTVKHLSHKDIEQMRCPIPPPMEQKAIAEALSDVDALIAALDKKIAKKRLIKQGAMQQLLTGKKRLPGFSEKWVFKKLGEIARIKTGKRNGEEQVKNGKYPFFVRSNVVARIDSYSFDGEAILVPGEGGIGAIFHYVNGKFDYHQRVYKISDFADAIYGKYVYYYMQRYFGEYALSLSVKATVDSLRLPTFEEFSIVLPNNIEEQQAIATILSDMDKEIANLEARRDKYKLIKSGMMQKLLTGQIRLIKPLAPIIPLATPENKIREIPLQTHIVAGHIVNKLYQSSGWGRTKLQKTLHLVGYHCQLDFGNEYIRNTAGPDDQAMMNHIDSKFKQYRHVKIEAKKDKGKTRYNYIPTEMIDELELVYETYPQTIRNAVDLLINKIKKMDLARAEIVSTLYAVWNNRIIKGAQISDDLLLTDFYAWSKHKSDFSRDLVLRGLNYMRKEKIIPTGWGKYIDKSNNIK